MITQVLSTPVKSSTDEKKYRVIQLPNGLRALLISDKRVCLKSLDEEERVLDETMSGEDDNDEDEEMEEEESGEDSGSDDEEGEKEGSEDNKNGSDDEVDMRVKLGHPKKNSTSGLKKSAAGLCVGMGSFSDPEELPGLAHFLEHMVFMGSKKYPDENAFDKFVHKHGGTDNAHTDTEKTVFYFESHRKHFKDCLDRFSQFFIEPLLKKEAMQREREAVDSEFQMALPDDYCRNQQIFGSLAKKSHPMSKFFWGNLESLQLAKLEDENVHKMLREFKDRHYCAKDMTLAIQSQNELDTLQAWVEEYFSGVPNSDIPRQTFSHLLEPFETPEFNKIYKVAPVQNVYQLDMNWALPPLMDKYRSKPLHYLSWIIGHEGEGSLISYLRKKVWALSLTAGNHGDGVEFNTTCSLFAITIVLTKAGHEHIREVLDAVFSYLKMMREKGPVEQIFREIAKIEQLSFDFGEESQPIDRVEHFCAQMQDYPPELYLTGEHLMFDYDPDLISDCANRLNVDGVNIFLLAREYKDICCKTERWFRTNYIDEDIPSDWKDRWNNIEVFPELFLPAPNRFIAEDVSIKAPVDEQSHYPVKIIDEADGELFYRKDEIFKQPRALIYLHLYSPLVAASVQNAVCLDIMVGCLGQQMVEDVYPADLALLHYSFYAGERGIVIKLNGINDKLPLLLETILSHFSIFESKLTDDMFKAVRDQTKKNYYNNFIKPMKLVRELRLFILQDVFHTNRQKHSIIESITKEQVCEFAKAFCQSNLFVQGLVQGNVTQDEAIHLYKNSRLLIGPQNPEMTAKVTKKRCNAVKSGSKYVRVHTFNAKDSNTVVTNYYQDKPGTLESLVNLEVGCMIMSEPCFDTLRTKEQLGYDVFSMIRNTFGVIGVSITVNSQATKFTAEHVDSRIEAFIDWFTDEKLINLSDEDFNQIVTSLIKAKKTADVTLEEEVNRNWNEIISGEYLFDRHAKEISLLEACQKESMVAYMNGFLKKSDSRRKLSVQVVGNADAFKDNEVCNGVNGAELTNVEVVVDEEGVFELSYYLDNKGDHDLPSDALVSDVVAYKASLTTYPILHIIE